MGNKGGGCCEHCDQVGPLTTDVAVVRAIVERMEKAMVTRAEFKPEELVTRGEFKPVRGVAYGLVLLMATAFVGAVAAAVLP
jgi:uncharacterized Zn finger protein